MKEVSAVINWFIKNQRDLPWRKSTPWGVVVSEFMLQQTPVERVLPIWNLWMKTWPTPGALAKASKAEVITAWGKLGYPRRALRLHECAQIIDQKYDGNVPESYAELIELPGVGDYTANAIRAFAFSLEANVLDTNIRRVITRWKSGIEYPSQSITRNERELAATLIPKVNSHQWAAASMELGALICTSKNPLCVDCPLNSTCSWKNAGYPPSEVKKKTQSWHGTDRQCRGRIMDAVKVSPTSINDIAWSEQSQLERAIASLVLDGLIIEDEGIVRLP